MKAIPVCLSLLFVCILACKDGAQNSAPSPSESDILEQIARAHGFDHWDSVEELQFTFNVDRDTTHFERTWIWRPKANEVTAMGLQDTVTYLRSEVDSTLADTDAAFINDKYWLLAPYQLVWDRDSFTFDLRPETPSPLSETPMQRLTIVYGDQGGYTPGDAYDLYLDGDNKVREWTFRRANKPAPGSDATWENYETYEGLELATFHQLGGGATLYFDGISVRTKN